jgi:hypothetical protein
MNAPKLRVLKPVFSSSANELVQFSFNQRRVYDLIQENPALGMDEESNLLIPVPQRLSCGSCRIDMSGEIRIVSRMINAPADSCYTGMYWKIISASRTMIGYHPDTGKTVSKTRPFEYCAD